MVHGAIDMKEVMVMTHMIPIETVFRISNDTVLNRKCKWEIMTKGYSRIPVYRGSNRDNLCGIFMVKKLIGLEEEDLPLSESDVQLRMPIVCHPQTLILDLLGKFREGKSHMAFVTE